jgi:AbrB family looped-hinge helix DNA binding protein
VKDLVDSKFLFNVRRVIGIRGRITIPYHIRETLGIRFNDVLSFSVGEDPNTVIIKKLDICNNCTKEEMDKARMDEFKSFLNEFSKDEIIKAVELLERKYRAGDLNAK